MPSLNSDQSSSCRQKLKRDPQEEVLEDSSQQILRKRRKMSVSSTPQWEYRGQDQLMSSPLAASPVFSLSSSVSSLGSSFSDSKEERKIQAVGLSPLIRKLLIRPKNESEEFENKRILTETRNLTRAALSCGLIEDDEHEELDIDLIENALYKPFPI